MAQALVGRKVQVTIATTHDNDGNASVEAPFGTPAREDNMTVYYFRRNILPYKISFSLRRWVRQAIGDFDLVHIHALFSFASTAAAFAAAAKNVPYIVRPLGVLNRWGLENRRAVLKRVSLALVERRILSQAAAVHYTTAAERTEANMIGSWIASLPSFVSPLPVDPDRLVQASDVEGRRSDRDRFLPGLPQLQGKRIILFLSRIDRKKGIELLLNAFPAVRKIISDAALVIAGGGERSYEASLRKQADKLGISRDVIWAGFLHGRDKVAALSAAEIFVLPSYSENFGIAAAEALAAGKPCILSDQVGLAVDARRSNSAIVVPCNSEALAEAIIKLLGDPAQQQTLGQAGRKFVKDYLSLQAVGAQLEAAYHRALGQNGGS
jgi:glycosyltransferase involved in cell wall biosynthesis